MAHVRVLILLVLAAAARATEVPAVGCPGAGQVGTPARDLKPVSIPGLDAATAAKLAFYEYRLGLAVLAPRGWSCFGLTGASGLVLAISSENTRDRLWNSGFASSAVMISATDGGGFGRFAVAEMIAAVFPAKRAFFEDSADFKEVWNWTPEQNGPYPADKLTYTGNTIVEYVTPAQSEGLGTRLLKKGTAPISGVAMLVGTTPVVVQLGVRLPANLAHLTPSIIAHTRKFKWRGYN